MKITCIAVHIEPNEHEKEKGQVTRVIGRTEDKLWDSVGSGGLFPYEIKLANDIQDLIAKFNGNQK